MASTDEDPTSAGRSDRHAREWLAVRVRLVGRAGAVGFVLGVLGVILFVAASAGEHTGSSAVFSLGALAFGFALLGWSGSVAAGRSVEAAGAYLGADTGWTEAGSRRAMARIGGFGTGTMVGASIATVLFSSVPI